MCGIVIDAGFSFTQIVPIFSGSILKQAVRRINLGGRALTNYFKELVSFRSINLMEETYLVEHIFKQVAFVSQDINKDLELSNSGGGKMKKSGGGSRKGANSLSSSPYFVEYVLPDGIKEVWGHIKSNAATTTTTNNNNGEGGGGAAGGAGGAAAAPGAGAAAGGSSNQQPQQPQQQQEKEKDKENENVLVMNNERFMVPEALFSPGDIGRE